MQTESLKKLALLAVTAGLATMPLLTSTAGADNDNRGRGRGHSNKVLNQQRKEARKAGRHDNRNNDNRRYPWHFNKNRRDDNGDWRNRNDDWRYRNDDRRDRWPNNSGDWNRPTNSRSLSGTVVREVSSDSFEVRADNGRQYLVVMRLGRYQDVDNGQRVRLSGYWQNNIFVATSASVY